MGLRLMRLTPSGDASQLLRLMCLTVPQWPYWVGNELVKTGQTKGEILKKHADRDRADEGKIRMRVRHINQVSLRQINRRCPGLLCEWTSCENHIDNPESACSVAKYRVRGDAT